MSDAAVLETTPANKGKILSFPIAKVDEAKREVWGYASTEALDQQNEIVDYDASVRAFDKWTSQFDKISGGKTLGNVREMHTSKAVGSVIAYQPDPVERGIWVGVKISNSVEGNDAWQKVQDRVLNGFSIGAPTATRRQEYHGSTKVNRVVEYNLAELSLVDNPACPESFFHAIKLASTFADGPAAYEMSIMKRFDADAKPSGQDWGKPAAQPIQKAVELNPDTFVDGSGEVWTRINGKISKRENAMADPKELEKAGKKIGPDHKPAGVPPGPKADTEKDAPAEPMPKAEGMGKDAVPASNPPLGGDGSNDGRNSGNGEQEKQIKSEKPGPAGQGKAAASDEDDMDAAKANDPDIDGKIAGSGFSNCGHCGGPLKAFGEGSAPYHKRCAMSKQEAAKSAGATKAVGIAGGMTEEGLSKAIASAINPILATVNSNFKALEERLVKMEKSPAPGGPARTELPPGVGVVEKAAGAPVAEGEAVVKALELAMPSIHDPMARQAVQMQITKSAIKAAQRGVMG